MKDLPMFTTQNGIASLTLREIPYTSKAYILLQSSLSPKALLEECRDFCRAVGAEYVYASGDEVVEEYPYHTTVVTMQCAKACLPASKLCLFPVQEQTVGQWKDIYNEKASSVPNAAWMTDADCKTMLQSGEGYFVHDGETLCGIGRVDAEEIKWVASCVPGMGADVLCALASIVPAETIRLQVADTNIKAMRLYERLGFVAVQSGRPWHCILQPQ